MDRYHGNKVFVDYLYVNHTRLDVCVKTRILNFEPREPEDVPMWHASVFDLNNASHPRMDQFSLLKEKLLKPVALFPDPFRGGRHKMVLCDVMEDATTPMAWSYRSNLIETAKQTKEHDTLMGFEQEFYFSGDVVSTELMSGKQPAASYHDQIGLVKGIGFQRKMVDCHVNACLTAGLNVYGYNREKARGQWEYQLGPSDPVTLADHTVVSRYILKRIAEQYNADVTFDPLPEGLFPSSLQLNFSTKTMRQEGGLREISNTLTAMSNLPQEQLLKHYDRHGGRDNAARLCDGFFFSSLFKTYKDLAQERHSSTMNRFYGAKVFVDYLYTNHTRLDTCIKTRILNFEPRKPKDIPMWHASVFDLNDASHPRMDQFSLLKEKLLKPVALFPDPFRGGRHKMVLCEVMEDATTPVAWSHRGKLVEMAKQTEEHDILMGFEQEFYFSGDIVSTELMPGKQPAASYHDQIGLVNGIGLQRKMTDCHVNACLTAGLNVYGYNREKARGQWEYQLGPSDPVTLADHTVVSRYILKRIAEQYNADVTFDPLPEGLFPSSLQLNFSTKTMRQEGGLREISNTLTAMSNLPQEQLLKHYDRHGGRDNAARLCGDTHLPAHTFKVGWGDKTSAIRVPSNVIQNGCGYFEERRPSSDCDPYELAAVFIKAAILNKHS